MITLGVDEAGRGALIGNVVAAAVILPVAYETGKINDSKQLSENAREQIAIYIRDIAIAYGIGRATPKEIDTLNIHHATLLAMQRAIKAVSEQTMAFDEVWVDGKFIPEIKPLNKPAIAFVKGDALHDCIAAASILAKTTRDAELRALDKRYPQYGFAAHKGYPTSAHRQAIIKYGVLADYRRSYQPIKNFIANK